MTRTRSTTVPEPPPDLVRRAREGEREALEALVEAVHPLVHRWALVRTGDPAEAADITQDALVTVVRRIGSFRGESRFTSWLYRIVGNAAADRGRVATRRTSREERWEMRSDPPVPAHDAADGLDRERLVDRVRDCFRRLTDRQREIFELCELEGLDSVEAGERLGVAPATVRVTLLRARRAVREEILRTDPELVEAFFT